MIHLDLCFTVGFLAGHAWLMSDYNVSFFQYCWANHYGKTNATTSPNCAVVVRKSPFSSVWSGFLVLIGSLGAHLRRVSGSVITLVNSEYFYLVWWITRRVWCGFFFKNQAGQNVTLLNNDNGLVATLNSSPWSGQTLVSTRWSYLLCSLKNDEIIRK